VRFFAASGARSTRWAGQSSEFRVYSSLPRWGRARWARRTDQARDGRFAALDIIVGAEQDGEQVRHRLDHAGLEQRCLCRWGLHHLLDGRDGLKERALLRVVFESGVRAVEGDGRADGLGEEGFHQR